MNKIYLAVLALALMACQSTPKEEIVPVFSSAVIEINADDISNYWVVQYKKPKMYNSKPKWLPKGAGEWVYEVTIDSNGKEVEKKLISTTPENYMTQAKLDQFPVENYSPSKNNPNKTPIKFVTSAKIMPVSKL